jgi:diguanylate cyclase (GGDEF)-like protein
MLLHSPDIPTLRLCSMLASMAFAAIFFVLWRRSRGETYLLHWGLSSLLYATALISFEMKGGAPSALASSLDYGLIALSDFLLVSGMRLFDGKKPFRPWMAIPIVATILAVALPLLLLPGGPMSAAASRVAGSVGLGTCMVICALAILKRTDGGVSLPRKIVGAAVLAYGPSYAISVWVELVGSTGTSTLDLLPMLQDQVLLGVLNLGLLATPWEKAIRQLRESVERDSLTGVWNRAALKKQDSELALPANSLFLIDIDHFKTINDTFGHAAGDSVLISFAARLQLLAAGRGGVFVRLGGDEFVLIAPTTNEHDAMALAEQVRVNPAPETTDLPNYSISVGLSRVHVGEQGLSLALARADRSLYRAKAGGRDQVAA